MRLRVLLGAALLAAPVAVSGCSPPVASGPVGPASTGASVAPLSVTVDQFRDGYASGTIVLQVTDTGSSGFTVTRAELTDPRFADGTAWTGSVAFDPGQTTSLPAIVAASRCPAPAESSTATGPHDAAPSVRVRLADGTERLVPAADPHNVLARLHTDGCFAAMVAAMVSLRLDDTLEPGPGGGTAVLTLRAEQSSAPRPEATPPASGVTLIAVGGTTLLDEDRSRPWPRGVVLGPGSTVRFSVRPARCDPHVVAEDKVGTLIPLTLEAGGGSGVVKAAASPALRAALYRFVAAACGWPGG